MKQAVPGDDNKTVEDNGRFYGITGGAAHGHGAAGQVGSLSWSVAARPSQGRRQ
jgi:hypothetical protein